MQEYRPSPTFDKSGGLALEQNWRQEGKSSGRCQRVPFVSRRMQRPPPPWKLENILSNFNAKTGDLSYWDGKMDS